MWVIKPRVTYHYESNAGKKLAPKPKEELPVTSFFLSLSIDDSYLLT